MTEHEHQHETRGQNVRVAITASAGWPWPVTIIRTLSEWWETNGAPVGATLVSSHGNPMDSIIEDWWVRNGGEIEHRIPDYATLGDRAWKIRDKEAARSRIDYALAFVYARDPKTEHYVEELRRAGVPIQAMLVG